MNKKFYRFACFFLGISLSVLVLSVQGNLSSVAQAVSAETQQQEQAIALTRKGHEQLDRSQAANALETWQATTKIYSDLQDEEGVKGSLINQSLALQALGMYPRACKTLVQALFLEDWVCHNRFEQGVSTEIKKTEKLLVKAIYKKPLLPVTVSGLHNLGDVLRLLGKLEESELTLQYTLDLAKNLKPSVNINSISLSLANTQRTLYNKFKDRYQSTEEPVSKETALKTAQEKAKLALSLYGQIVSSSVDKQDDEVRLQAKLNHLSLLIGLEKLPTEWEQKSQVPQVQLLVQELLISDFSNLPTISSIYARLNFASSLTQIAEQKIVILSSSFSPLVSAQSYSQEALKAARASQDKRTESYALGRLGKIYVQNQQTDWAQQFFEKALAAAGSIQAWDITYQWQQELGKIYKQKGKINQAIEAYEAAVNNLEKVRNNIIAVNPDIQFSFKEKVQPVYQEYLRLLLTSVEPNLEQVIKTNERLQLAELENFLQCGQLDLVSLERSPTTPNLPNIIYIIDLGERIEEIVRTVDGSLHRHSPNLEVVKSNAENILLNFQDERFDYTNGSFAYTNEGIILEDSQALYNQLIAPIKNYLPPSGTLVFVLDSFLQNLPMSLLYDGKDYLINKYSVSVTLNSQLRSPKALKPEQLKALIAGLSKSNPSLNEFDSFKNLVPLTQVETEIADIKQSTVSSVELLNEKFTSENFNNQIIQASFPIVHITTHGQFSSDPEQTAILAWDKVINISEFDRLLRGQMRNSQSALELLVLSACQTAKGDKRSALGLAGIATQAGARSTLASLWLVEEASTAQLMGKFYQGLKNGLPKAEALRQAQLALLANPKYAHPYYWSSFVLVGSWL